MYMCIHIYIYRERYVFVYEDPAPDLSSWITYEYLRISLNNKTCLGRYASPLRLISVLKLWISESLTQIHLNMSCISRTTNACIGPCAPP